MATTGAGTEGGAEAQAQTGAEGAQQGSETQAPDLQAVLDRFGELDDTFSERFEQLESRLPAHQEPGIGHEQQYGQQPPGGAEPELYLDEQTGQVVDAQGRPVDPASLRDDGGQIDPRVVQGLQQQMQSQMQQQLAPILEYFQDQQAAELEERYEPLRDTKYAEKIVSAAEERAAAWGNPALAKDPGLIELLHLAEVGRQRAAGQETPAGASETGVALETDGVSSPGPGEADLESQIDRALAARQKSHSFFD